jgi:hypothetical protein
MMPNFIEIGNTVLATGRISRIDFTKTLLTRKLQARLWLHGAPGMTVRGELALALRKFFAAPEAPAPAA